MENQNSQSKVKISPVGDLLERSFDLYKEGVVKLLALAALGVLASMPFAAFVAVWAFSSYLGFEVGQIASIFFVIISAILLLLAIYLGVSAQAGTYLYFKQNRLKSGILDIFNEARKNYFWSFLWVNILLGLILLVGFIALIIPGIILTVYLAFSVWVLIFEDKKGLEAIKRSLNLVKGYWWGVAGRFLLVYGVYWLAISLPMSVINSQEMIQAWNILTNIISFVLAPFFLAYAYVIYKDLVKIKSNQEVTDNKKEDNQR